MTKEEGQNKIASELKSKATLKQDVFCRTKDEFVILKEVLEKKVDALKEQIGNADERIRLEYSNTAKYESRICIGGDVLIFSMHTNVFKFDENNSIWKSSYLKEDEKRGYCGIINIYNFLADSFKYNRVNDAGYLVARVFINKDGYFMVDGKRKFGFLFNDFTQSILDEDQWNEIVNQIILFTLDFDLYIPPYENVNFVSVNEMKFVSDTIQLKTGKRVGFQFSYEEM